MRRRFTVVGIYTDNRQRAAFHVTVSGRTTAERVRRAEQAAREQAKHYAPSAELEIAGVYAGHLKALDEGGGG